MQVHISRNCREAVLRHAQEAYPHECCGILLGTWSGCDKSITRIQPILNEHHEDHARRYLITPDQMLRAERQAKEAGLGILGVYHSHPDHPARPSGYDLEWAWPWYSYVIVSVIDGRPAEVTCWTLSDDRSRFLEETLILLPSGDDICPHAS